MNKLFLSSAAATLAIMTAPASAQLLGGGGGLGGGLGGMIGGSLGGAGSLGGVGSLGSGVTPAISAHDRAQRRQISLQAAR